MSKLYCYFNENGDLLESIADGAVRRGNSGIDSIYVYWENKPSFDSLTTTYFEVDHISNEEDSEYSTVTEKIPPIKNQDLKYFVYGKDYQFMVIALPDFSVNGSYGLTLRAYLSSTQVAVLGTILFSVENSVAKLSPDITRSQYDYLLWLTTGIENKVPYTGATRDVDLGTRNLSVNDLAIAGVITSDGKTFTMPTSSGRLVVDGDLSEYVTKVNSANIVYGRNSLNQEVAYSVDADNNYGQNSVAKRYNGQLKAPTPLADSDLANKGYVDNEIASAIEGMEEKADVSDIVGTYAELQAYDTSKLVIGDIIKVLQDSTHSNAMSYYRWLGSEDGWEYIGSEGPYPTISEMNTALSGKVDKTTSSSKLYGTDSVGAQTTIPVEDNIGDVARRDDDGQLVVPLTPTANGQATSKKYVDDQDALDEKLANKVTSLSASSTNTQYASAKAIYDFAISLLRKSYQEVDTTEYPTVNDFLASTGEEGIFYLYPITSGFEQYIWENNAWVDLGPTTIDLSGYATKLEVEPRLFNVINASDITNNTLTQSQYDLITNGNPTLIKGNILSVQNPIIISLWEGGTTLFSLAFANKVNDAIHYLGYFQISKSTRAISFNSGVLGFNNGTNSILLKNKVIPNYPSDTGTYSIVCADGTLAWVDYLYTIALGKYVADNTITTLPYETISEISLSSDTTFSLKSAPTGCYPIYDAIITNVGSSAINITLTSIAKIICNDASITISNNVVTLPAGMVVELNIQNGCAIIINFDL